MNYLPLRRPTHGRIPAEVPLPDALVSEHPRKVLWTKCVRTFMQAMARRLSCRRYDTVPTVVIVSRLLSMPCKIEWNWRIFVMKQFVRSFLMVFALFGASAALAQLKGYVSNYKAST